LIQDGLPAEIVNLLSQAQPLMADAAGKIRATANEPAVPSQGKALGLITEIEKLKRSASTPLMWAANATPPTPPKKAPTAYAASFVRKGPTCPS